MKTMKHLRQWLLAWRCGWAQVTSAGLVRRGHRKAALECSEATCVCCVVMLVAGVGSRTGLRTSTKQ